MSKMLTAFLLLYMLCLHLVSPTVKPARCVTDKVINTASTDGKTSEHEEIDLSNHEDWYKCDTQASAAGRSIFPQSATIDQHDLSETFNMPSEHSIVLMRTKRMTVDTYGSAKEGWFIMKGRSVAVPCFTTGRRSPKWPEITKFKWFDANNKPVANNRYKNYNDGWLKISETEISDTGTYKCNIVGMDKKIKKTVSAALKVFILPTMYLQIKLYYEPKSCTVDARKQERDKVRGFLCEKGTTCQYKITSKCKVVTTKSGPVLGQSKNQHVVTAVRYMPSSYVSPHCKPKCMVNVIKRHLDEEKTSALKKIPIGRKPSEQKITIKKQCLAGFTLYKEMMCLPCQAGTYCNAGDDVCTPCPRGQYQSELGMSKCNKCPKGQYTIGKGSAILSLCKAPHDLVMSMSINTMRVEHYATLGAVPLVIILIIIICCCAQRSKKKPKKTKDKLIKDEDDTVHRSSKVGFVSDLGASTDMETDFKTEQSSSGSEGEETKTDSDDSVRKGRGKNSNNSGKKRNVNNSHRLLVTSNSSLMLENFKCSEPLVDTSTPDIKYLSMGGLRTQCNVLKNAASSAGEFQQTVQSQDETSTSPSRDGKNLAARLSVVDTSYSSQKKPETISINYAKQKSSDENNFLNNRLQFLSLDDVEVEEERASSTENSTTLDIGHSAKTTPSKDQTQSTKSFPISALHEVPISVRIPAHPRMAIYNNPACLPKPVTISRYSEASIRDLFPVSPPNTYNSITPEFINMTELNHRKSNISAHTDPEAYAFGHQMTLDSQADSGSVSSKHTITSNATLCAPNTDHESTETSTLCVDTQSSGYSNSASPQVSATSDIHLQPGNIYSEQFNAFKCATGNQLSPQSKRLFDIKPKQRAFRKDLDFYKTRAPNAVPLPPGSFNYLLPRSQATNSIPPLFTELNSAREISKSQSPAIISSEKASDSPEANPLSPTELRKMMTQRYGIPLPSAPKSKSENKTTHNHKTPPTPPPLPSSLLSISLQPTENTNKLHGALTPESSESHDKENASNLHRPNNEKTCIVSDTLEKLMLTMPRVGEAKITGPSSNSSNGKEISLTMSSNSGESQ